MYKITGCCFIVLEGDIIADKKGNRLVYLFSIMAIIFSVVTISIFALIVSSKIEIEDVQKPENHSWKVNFEDLDLNELTGSAQEISKPVIENSTTHVKNFYVSFKKSMDSATYTLAVKNNGIIDAKISTITFSKPVCHGSGKYAIEDATLVCNNIEVFGTYESGETIKVGDILKKDDKENIKLTIRYIGDMPKETVEIENLSMTIIYIQE